MSSFLSLFNGTAPPLLILAIGVLTVIGLIVFVRLHAFVALLISALLVSLLAPGELAIKVSRVAEAFGTSAGKIGIVIALAAIIGECMMASGAADRIVQGFLALLGQKRSSFALAASGYTLGIPVFFDTVFYLLVPLARSLYRQTKRNYLLYLTAIAAGGAVTHTLVPPTPGPLLIASQLKVDLGLMILVGMAVALPATLSGLAYAAWADRTFSVPYRELPGGEAQPLDTNRLPPLWLAILPVLLPVLLISLNTVATTLANAGDKTLAWEAITPYTAVLGDPNLALLLSMVVAVWLFWRQRHASLREITSLMDKSLMSGGVIILITAAGGAFGAMLKQAQIGTAIQELFQDPQATQAGAASGLIYLLLGFGIASLLKIAQGSSTVAMITASGMLAAFLSLDDKQATVDQAIAQLGFHPVYLALAIGAGSKVVSWMNDSGFWIFAKMGGLTEVETLKSWTPCLAIMGLVAFAVTLGLALIFPLTGD